MGEQSRSQRPNSGNQPPQPPPLPLGLPHPSQSLPDAHAVSGSLNIKFSELVALVTSRRSGFKRLDAHRLVRKRFSAGRSGGSTAALRLSGSSTFLPASEPVSSSDKYNHGHPHWHRGLCLAKSMKQLWTHGSAKPKVVCACGGGLGWLFLWPQRT